jgi:colanic acid biosynthesis glycosyl transferase WcaI
MTTSRSFSVLLLNQYFPPDTSATAKMAHLVADALAEHARVTVLAGRPSYDPSERHRYYMRRRETRGALTIERVGSTAYHRRKMTGRLSNYLSYLALAIPRALTIDADVVLSMTDPPVAGIAGAVVARLRRRPFVYNIRDLYPDMALAAGIVKPRGWVNAWERLHLWALREAKLIVVLGEDMRDRVIAKGIEPERVAVVRDGAPILGTVVSGSHPIAQEIRCGFPFVVLHAGNLGFYGAWQTLIDASRLLTEDGVGFVFVGGGALKARLESLANGCHGVRFMPFRPEDQVPYVMAAADIHVVTVRQGLEGVVVPSKLYAILASGRPVLGAVPERSDVARIVTEHRCGVVVDPEDAASLASVVRRLARDRAALEDMGQRARVAATKYERGGQLGRLVDLVSGVAQ